MTAEVNTPEGDRLDVLATLVEAYEAKHFPMELADPINAIKFTMEQRDLTEGPGADDRSVNRVYEILSGKRPLTLPMFWRLHEALEIPAEALIKPSKRRTAAV